MWFVSIIFAITLLGGSRVASCLVSAGGIGLSQVEDASSDVRDLLSRAAGLEAGTVSSDLEAFWDAARFEVALSAPDSHRDSFAVFVGRLEQITSGPFSPPGPAECFVRVPGSGPVIVLASVDDLDACALSDQVVVEGWFRGVEEARARDGVDRRYPVFVARLRGGAGAGLRFEPSLMVVVSCVMLGGLWWIIRRRLGRHSSGGRVMGARTSRHSTLTSARHDPDLPTDPVGALDELARRGDDSP